MGFTSSTTNVSVHQGLSDYPNQDDGLTAAQLKATFDFPAETLQNDLNGLETELEAVESASNIGADVIAVGDESDANVQAKLEKLASEMTSITQGAVADGSITQAKLAGTLVSSLAFKDGTLQSGLNSEQVGGNTLAQIKSYVDGGIVSSTYTGNTTNSTTTNTITLGFQPKFVAIFGEPHIAQNSSTGIALFVGGNGLVLRDGYTPNELTITLSSTGFTLTGKTMNYNGKTYTYVAFR